MTDEQQSPVAQFEAELPEGWRQTFQCCFAAANNHLAPRAKEYAPQLAVQAFCVILGRAMAEGEHNLPKSQTVNFADILKVLEDVRIIVRSDGEDSSDGAQYQFPSGNA